MPFKLNEEKRDKLLNFLLVEKWCNANTANLLLGDSHVRSTRRYLDTLVKHGYLSSDKVYPPSFREMNVYIITPSGAGLVADVDVLKNFVFISASKIALNSIIHFIDLQKLHINALKNGFSFWTKPDYRTRVKGVHYPDAIATKNGKGFAFELERTFKSYSRYRFILTDFYHMIKKGEIAGVVYVSPTLAIAEKLKAIYHSLDYIDVDGEKMNTGNLVEDRFTFVDYNKFGF